MANKYSGIEHDSSRPNQTPLVDAKPNSERQLIKLRRRVEIVMGGTSMGTSSGHHGADTSSISAQATGLSESGNYVFALLDRRAMSAQHCVEGTLIAVNEVGIEVDMGSITKVVPWSDILTVTLGSSE